MSKVLQVVGVGWLIVAGLVIVLGYGMVLWQQGFWALAEMLSPWNIINYVVVMLTLAPGVAILMVADRMKAKKG